MPPRYGLPVFGPLRPDLPPPLDTAIFETLIYKGHTTTAFPEVCALIRNGPQGNEVLRGTGILVHPRLIVTVSHVANSPVVAAFPVPSLRTSAVSTRHALELQFGTSEPKPVYEVCDNRIGLLFLQEEVNPAFALPHLATPADFARAQALPGTGMIVGFGLNSDREKLVGEKMSIGSWPSSEQPSAQATDCLVTGESGNCLHDSGGPYYLETAQGKVLVGIADRRASTVSPFTCGPEGIYFRIDTQLAGIRQKALAHGIKLP